MLREGGRDIPPAQSSLADLVLQEAHDVGVRVHEVSSEAGHPAVRLAEVMALTDFLSTYAALGLGLDPSTNPHVANLRAAGHP